MKIKAFTLVELMVVMAIIAFLSVGAYGGLTFALRQGRDTQRMRIADQVQTALTAYYADYSGYPSCAGAAGVSGATGVFTCNAAFEKTGMMVGSEGVLLDYFESEFTWGPISSDSSVDNDMRYYFVPKTSSVSTGHNANKFTVCVTLENQNGGNVKEGKNNTGEKKGCYCVGANQKEVACAMMQ
jgi:prepilin-type N-terminal cleavage/methylation domain-containing protein